MTWPTIPHDGPAYRTVWSAEDQQYVGLCDEFPSLSWLADMPEEAALGIRLLVRQITDDGTRHDLDDVIAVLGFTREELDGDV